MCVWLRDKKSSNELLWMLWLCEYIVTLARISSMRGCRQGMRRQWWYIGSGLQRAGWTEPTIFFNLSELRHFCFRKKQLSLIGY